MRKGLKSIDDRLERFFVAKGKMTAAEKTAVMGRIKGYTSIEEAVQEMSTLSSRRFRRSCLSRERSFKKLDENAPEAILASNTSTLNITEMAADTKRPERVIGMHFFNPVAMMKLVEVVRGAHTSDETVAVVVAMARKLGKGTGGLSGYK